MVDSALLSVLTGTGVAGVFCALFILGLIFPRSVVSDLKDEIRALKEENKAQRERADTAVAAASATRDVLAAFQAGTQVARMPPDGHPQVTPAPPPAQVAGPP